MEKNLKEVAESALLERIKQHCKSDRITIEEYAVGVTKKLNDMTNLYEVAKVDVCNLQREVNALRMQLSK